MIDREKDMALADKLCEVIKAEGNISLHDVAVAMVITQLTYGKDPIRTMNLLQMTMAETITATQTMIKIIKSRKEGD